jgi:aspartate racemase
VPPAQPGRGDYRENLGSCALVSHSSLWEAAKGGACVAQEQPFLRDRLVEQHGLGVLVPEANDRAVVNRVIYEELCLGMVREESRAQYREVIRQLVERGAEGVILGCTEITLLVEQADSPVPVFDTTRLHALAAVEFALAPAISEAPAARVSER